MTDDALIKLGKWLEDLDEVSSFTGGFMPVKVDGTNKKLFKISYPNFVKDLPATPSGNPHINRFYVNVNGDDTANGAPETPFKTLQYAISVIASGDILILAAGSYGNIVIDKAVIIQGASSSGTELITDIGDITFTNNFIATNTVISNCVIAATATMSGATSFFLMLDNCITTIQDSSISNLIVKGGEILSSSKTMTLSGLAIIKNAKSTISVDCLSLSVEATNYVGNVIFDVTCNLDNSYLEGNITGIVGAAILNVRNTTHVGNVIDVDSDKVSIKNQSETGIEEAPIDGIGYSRKDAGWTQVSVSEEIVPVYTGYTLVSSKNIVEDFEPGLDWHGRTSLVDNGNGIWMMGFIAGTSHSPGVGEVLKSGIVFSNDEGRSWSKKNKYIDGTNIVGFEREGGAGGFTGDMHIIKCPDGSILCISHDRTSVSLVFEDTVISRSVDGGKNWDAYRSIGAQFENGVIDTWGIYDHYIESNRIYITVTTCPDRATQVLTDNKTMLYYSDDQGENWTKEDDINTLAEIELEGGITKMPNGSFISVSANRIDWSIDSNVFTKAQGGSWTKIGVVGTGGSVHQARLKYFRNESRLYMFGRWQIAGVRKNAMYWSDDNGATWDVFFPTGDITDGGYTDCLKRNNGTFYVVGYYGSSFAANLQEYIIQGNFTDAATGTVPSYADTTAMRVDLSNQIVDALYFDIAENSTYRTKTLTAGTIKSEYDLISAPSQHREYVTMAALFADQANQWYGQTYYVEGTDAEVQTFLIFDVPLLGTPNGDITDYKGGGEYEEKFRLYLSGLGNVPASGLVPDISVFAYEDYTVRDFNMDVTLAPSGGPCTLDILVDTVSILTNKVVIDTGETSTHTAAVKVSISNSTFNKGSTMTFSFDNVNGAKTVVIEPIMTF